MVEKARSEMRAILMTHLSLLDRSTGETSALPQTAPPALGSSPPVPHGPIPTVSSEVDTPLFLADEVVSSSH